MTTPHKIIAVLAKTKRGTFKADEIADAPERAFKEIQVRIRIADQWLTVSQHNVTVELDVDGERTIKSWRECANADIRGQVMERMNASRRKARQVI